MMVRTATLRGRFSDAVGTTRDASKLLVGYAYSPVGSAFAFEGFIISWEWASMPGSPYGQPVISLDTARAVYVDAGGSSY